MLHMYIYTGFDETNILVSISFLYLNPISGINGSKPELAERGARGRTRSLLSSLSPAVVFTQCDWWVFD